MSGYSLQLTDSSTRSNTPTGYGGAGGSIAPAPATEGISFNALIVVGVAIVAVAFFMLKRG